MVLLITGKRILVVTISDWMGRKIIGSLLMLLLLLVLLLSLGIINGPWRDGWDASRASNELRRRMYYLGRFFVFCHHRHVPAINISFPVRITI